MILSISNKYSVSTAWVLIIRQQILRHLIILLGLLVIGAGGADDAQGAVVVGRMAGDFSLRN